MNWQPKLIQFLGIVYTLMLCGAIFSHAVLREAPLQGQGSSSFLYVAGGLVLLAAAPTTRLQLVIVGCLGFIAELAGVHSGFIFGHYTYTQVLAPNVWGTPIVMICAWFVLYAYIDQLLLDFRLSVLAKALCIATGMTALDLVIDPLAAHPFNFWNWHQDGAYYGIPVHNFFGWFMVSFVVSLVISGLFKKPVAKEYWALMVGLGILIFYTIAAFAYGYVLAGAIGAGLLIVHYLIVFKFSQMPKLAAKI